MAAPRCLLLVSSIHHGNTLAVARAMPAQLCRRRLLTTPRRVAAGLRGAVGCTANAGTPPSGSGRMLVTLEQAAPR